MRRTTALFAPLALAATACSAAPADRAPVAAKTDRFAIEPKGSFASPWAMTYLPDGRALITEKAGLLVLLSADAARRIIVAGTPTVDTAGQGGLMDVVLHPRFAENRVVYLTWSASVPGGKAVHLGRGVLAEQGSTARLDRFTVLWRAAPAVTGNGHYSGRVAFAPDGHLFITAGERQKFTPAQDLAGTLGKVLRLTEDGKPAPGNPLVGKGNPATWSWGHRNLLGLTFDANGRLWAHEMGPAHGDEVNLILPARNYGWPQASNGSHYDGRDMPDHRAGDGFEAPKVWWKPAISPAGLIAYSGKLWPAWRGHLFIGGLGSEALIRVAIDGDRAAKGDQWPMGARIREVEEAPDGAIMLLEDGPGGRLLRLTPGG